MLALGIDTDGRRAGIALVEDEEIVRRHQTLDGSQAYLEVRRSSEGRLSRRFAITQEGEVKTTPSPPTRTRNSTRTASTVAT